MEVEGTDEAVEERVDVGAWAMVELMGMSMWLLGRWAQCSATA